MKMNDIKSKCPEYLSDFLQHIIIIENRSIRTQEAYYTDLIYFLRYLLLIHNDISDDTDWENVEVKSVPFSYVKEFTLKDAYEYMTWLKTERNNEAAARSRKGSSLKHFYSYLYNKVCLLESNPMETLELPRVKHALPKYLSLEEAQKLLQSIETNNTERDYCIITLFLNCGMRLSELCGINMKDISFDNRTVRLLGKGNKERIVALNDSCISAINAYLPYRAQFAEKIKSDALFFSRKYNRISKRRVQEIVEECINKAGLSNTGVTTHKLRHTAATLMYQYGDVDPLVLKNILGHSNLNTTEIYTHLVDNNVREAVDSNPLNK